MLDTPYIKYTMLTEELEQTLDTFMEHLRL